MADATTIEIARGDSRTASDGELHLRLLQPLVHYVGKTYGTDAIDSLARELEMSESDLVKANAWVSHGAFEATLQSARRLMTDDDEFRRAFKFQLRDSWGPLGYLVRAASVGSVLGLAVKTMHHVSRISRYEVLESDRRSIRCRYHSERAESRLMCLSRQASIEAMPTAWGLPSAQLEELSCIAKGDACCEYAIQWHEQPRWLPVFIGAGVVGLLGWWVQSIGVGTHYFVAMATVLGGVLGYAAELWRTQLANTRFSQETNDALRELARQTVEAMEEVQALRHREQEWTGLIEEQVTERTQALQHMLGALQRLDERRDTTLRVVSHDSRSPLAGLKLNLEMLQDEPDGQERKEMLADALEATQRVERLVQELSAWAETGSKAELVNVVPTTVDVGKLVDRLRRSLRAMIWGRKIRTSVFRTPECPSTFETDIVLFDRVVDNLLANAAKCTEQGSILVELAGSPGMVTVKVSDTGPGIADERIEKVFRVGETTFADSGRGSGLGLPIVVRLLDQIGGRLEVLSQPGKGTTFWAHFPTSLPSKSGDDSEPPIEEAIDRVVTIRRTN